MEDHQVQGFYNELAALCSKYDVEGFVGMWFSANTENYGFIHGSPQDGGKMCRVCLGISLKLREWCDAAHPGPLKFQVEPVAIEIKKGGKK
jgi:hypothetical protein